jgi:hypothetical protein
MLSVVAAGLRLSTPSQVYKRKAIFLLGVARVRKRNQNDTSALV